MIEETIKQAKVLLGMFPDKDRSSSSGLLGVIYKLLKIVEGRGIGIRIIHFDGGSKVYLETYKSVQDGLGSRDALHPREYILLGEMLDIHNDIMHDMAFPTTKE